MTKPIFAIAAIMGLTAMAAWMICAVGRELCEFPRFYEEGGDEEC